MRTPPTFSGLIRLAAVLAAAGGIMLATIDGAAEKAGGEGGGPIGPGRPGTFANRGG